MTGNLEEILETYDLLPQEREELSRLFATHHPLIGRGADIVRIIKEEVDLGKVPVVGVLLYEAVLAELTTPEAVQTLFGEQVATFVNSLLKVGELYRNHPPVESDAFPFGYVLQERKQLFELGRERPYEVVCSGGDDVVGILKSGDGGVSLVVLDGEAGERDRHEADNGFTHSAGALELDLDHGCYGF